MILQALKEYYDRKPELPRLGFELKEIPYIIVLNSEGKPVNLVETYEGTGKERRPKLFLVPQAVKRSVGIRANLLWDNPEYALGVVCKGKPERVADQHSAFVKRIDTIVLRENPGLIAVQKFLSKPNKADELEIFGGIWEEIKKSGANISFQLAGQTGLIAEQPIIQSAIDYNITTKGESVCLVTGQVDIPERLHPAIKGVWGAQSSGANIVSFNLDAFQSFNKKQGANAPVGKSAVFAYTTALNHLLGKTSKQRMQVGDASTIFWAQTIHPLEEQIPSFFGEPPRDDPDRNVRAIESFYKSVHTGAFSINYSNTRFYVLGLAPNASRIAIRFWIMDTVSGMANNICQYFEDIKIAHGPRDKEFLSLFRLLVSTAALGKSENILPNLAGDFMRSILENRPYSHTLLLTAIRRLRA
jgi:CRISPR-associated protein Csd1